MLIYFENVLTFQKTVLSLTQQTNKKRKKMEIKTTTKDTNGTGFHGDTFRASVNQIINLIGQPAYKCAPEDKVTHVWEMELHGSVFTIYDWKEYRELQPDEKIDWHIGARNRATSQAAAGELRREIFIRG